MVINIYMPIVIFSRKALKKKRKKEATLLRHIYAITINAITIILDQLDDYLHACKL